MSRLDRPLVVVGNARSGTTLFRSLLERSPALFRLGRESRFLWNEWTHPFDPSRQRLPDAEGVARAYLRACFLPTGPDDPVAFVDRLVPQGANPWYYEIPLEARSGTPPEGPPFAVETPETTPFTTQPPGRGPAPGEAVRLLDKDTGHVYRIPHLRAFFPDARFVFVVRDATAAVSSLMEAWLHPRWFFSYRMPAPLGIAGYSDRFPWGREWWNLNLPPDWRDLVDRPLEEVCARTWASGNAEILRHLGELGDQALLVRYEEITSDPARVMDRVAAHVQVDPRDLALPPGFRPEAVVTEEEPSPTKWERNRARILAVRPWFEEVQERLGYRVPA